MKEEQPDNIDDKSNDANNQHELGVVYLHMASKSFDRVHKD